MEYNQNINGLANEALLSVVGSYRTFGADGVLYEVLGIDTDKPGHADILVVETGERTLYPLDQLLADPIAQ